MSLAYASGGKAADPKTVDSLSSVMSSGTLPRSSLVQKLFVEKVATDKRRQHPSLKGVSRLKPDGRLGADFKEGAEVASAQQRQGPQQVTAHDWDTAAEKRMVE